MATSRSRPRTNRAPPKGPSFEFALAKANGTIAALLSTVLRAIFDDTATSPAQLWVRVLGHRTLAMLKIVERAVQHGELAAPLPLGS